MDNGRVLLQLLQRRDQPGRVAGERHAADVRVQESVFRGPMGIELDVQDRILVADCCKHRIQVYRQT